MPAKKIPYFKPSKELKDVVNNSGAASGLLLAGATEPVIFDRQLCAGRIGQNSGSARPLPAP